MFPIIDNNMEVLAANPAGIEIVLHEKYGPDRCDTGTVVWWDKVKACWVVTHRDRPASYYPRENYSLEIKKEK